VLSKSSADVFHFGLPVLPRYCGDIEADVVEFWTKLVVPAPEAFAGASETRALPTVDAPERRGPGIAAARAHFDQDQGSAVLDEQVDLEIVHAQVDRQHAETACFEPVTNCFFCGEAKTAPLTLTLGRFRRS